MVDIDLVNGISDTLGIKLRRFVPMKEETVEKDVKEVIMQQEEQPNGEKFEMEEESDHEDV